MFNRKQRTTKNEQEPSKVNINDQLPGFVVNQSFLCIIYAFIYALYIIFMQHTPKITDIFNYPKIFGV